MKKPKKNGFLLGALGTLFVVLGVIVYVVFSSLLTRLFMIVRFADVSAGAIMTVASTSIVVAFALFEAIFITWQIKLAKEASKSEDSLNMSKLLRIVTISAVTLSILLAIFNANTFTELRSDSISKICFVRTSEYRWNDGHNDVKRYTFICDESGGLSFNVTMNDGEVIQILGGITSHSDKFKGDYNTDKVHLLKYCADLAEDFSAEEREYKIDCRISSSSIKNAKEFYQSNEASAEVWAEIERIIATYENE